MTKILICTMLAAGLALSGCMPAVTSSETASHMTQAIAGESAPAAGSADPAASSSAPAAAPSAPAAASSTPAGTQSPAAPGFSAVPLTEA